MSSKTSANRPVGSSLYKQMKTHAMYEQQTALGYSSSVEYWIIIDLMTSESSSSEITTASASVRTLTKGLL